jgi:hypothetical protein
MCTIALLVWLPGTPVRQGIDPQEVLQYFSWLAYALVAAAYTAVVFGGELSKEGPRIFSKRNARSVSQVIAAHSACLTILLCFLRLASYIVLTLPHWMTNTLEGEGGRSDRSRITIADLLFLLASIVMAQIEQKRLFVQSETDSAEPNESATVPNAD